MTRANADNLFGLSSFIVDPSPAHGSFTTVQSAIDAAVLAGGKEIFIKPGTYTENLVFPSATINLIGVQADGRPPGPTVIIEGNHTFNGSGSQIIFESIAFTAAAGDNFTLTNNAASGSIFAWKYVLVNSSTGRCIVANATAGGIFCASFSSNFQANLTCVEVQDNCALQGLDNSNFNSNSAAGIDLSGTGSATQLLYSQVAGETAGILISNVSANASIEYCEIDGNSNASIVFAAAGTVSASNCTYNSNNVSGFYIAGTGSYSYAGDVLFHGTAFQIDPAVTQTPFVWRPFATSGNSGSAVRGTCGFDSTQFNVTDGFVQITSAPSSITWSDQPASTTVGVNTGSFTLNPITLTLPPAPTEGQEDRFFNTDGSTLIVQANAGQVIRIGNVASGIAGTATSTSIGDGLWLTFRSTNNTWYALVQGNWALA